jgi:hypothetical protein
LVAVHLKASDAIARIDVVDDVQQGLNWVHFETGNHRGFARVDFRDDQTSYLSDARLKGNGQRTADSTKAAVEREFTDKKGVGNLLLIQAAVGAKDAERHGKIETGTFFADVRGREIDRYVSGWNVVATIF